MAIKQLSPEVPTGAIQFRNDSVPVAVAGNTSLGIINTIGMGMISLNVSNAVGGGALDAFIIQYKYHPTGSWITMASTAGNFTNPDWPIVRATASPVTLAANASVQMVVDVLGAAFVQILASANTTASVVTIEGMGTPHNTGAAVSGAMANYANETGGNLATIATSLGATTAAPVADNTTVEDATARTGISLLKRIVNVLIAILGKFNTKIADADLTTAIVNVAGGSFQSLGLVTNAGTDVGRFVTWSVSAGGANGTLELGYGTAADGTGWNSIMTINLAQYGGDVWPNPNLLKLAIPTTVAKNNYMLLKATGAGLTVNGLMTTAISTS